MINYFFSIINLKNINNSDDDQWWSWLRIWSMMIKKMVDDD
jgi:hypothetical protein